MLLKEMTITPHKLLVLLIVLFLALLAIEARAEDHLNLAGTVKNTQGKGVKDVGVEVTVNGRPRARPGTRIRICPSWPHKVPNR